ncbi:protein SUPPRESSOR OF npr1-1, CONSTITUTIVE 1-like [Prunus persica]|uniref:protein SUPPRESSOR OF npr1-1, CONSTITUTIVE 1-like n=1 Tax=Prunus persica TaxID=3760 RepID=UPI0009AB74BF|nr:protein SUPPRESSOR OF npr1-1, CONSTITUTIVE 1-like [Prunus persica]
MHDLIRGMGTEIVRLESNEPWKRSRVLHHKDSFKILTEKNGTETIEGLVLDMQMCPTINSNEKVLETNAFSRMRELKLLHLSHVQLNGSYAEFCTGLIWLCWTKFPLDSIPVDFPLESVIILEMQYSGLRQVFKGTKYLPSLKILDLNHSHSLTETIDFSYCPNLEKLVLVDCTSLIYVHGSIGNLERLIYLNMKDCKNLRMLPKNICMLKSLETFIISGCSNLSELSTEMLRNMDALKVLETDGIPISELWLEKSSSILGSLPCALMELSLWGCNLSDDALPMDFSNLSSLQRLNLGNNPISSLPNCIKGLTRLHTLSLNECTILKSLLGLPKLKDLHILNCTSLEKITYQSSSSVSCTYGYNHNLVEWQYKYKLQPIGSVDVEMINLLGLCNLLESMAPIRIHTLYGYLQNDDPIPVQGLYEHGIFSTVFGGNKVPGKFSHKSRGSSISFTVPLLDNHRTRGLIVFVVYVNAGYDSPPIIHHNYLSQIIVKNKSNGLRGRYCPSRYGIPGEGEDMIWLSHWNLEDDQLQGGDEVVVSVIMKSGLLVKELGIRLVQMQQEENHNMMSISTDSSSDDRIWYNKCLGDSDEEDKREEVFSRFVCLPDEEEEQQDDITVATTTGSNNSGGLRGWKVLVTTACFFLTLTLITRSSPSRRKKQPSTSPG